MRIVIGDQVWDQATKSESELRAKRCEDWVGGQRQYDASLGGLSLKQSQSQGIRPGSWVSGHDLLGQVRHMGEWSQERQWASVPPLSTTERGEAAVLTLSPSHRLAKEDMQFERPDGADVPLGEAHGDFLQRLLPVGPGTAAGSLLGRRLSLMRRKNSCVSEASTAASCAGTSALDGIAPECDCGDLLLDSGLREPELEPHTGPEPPAPGPDAEPFTAVPMTAPRGPAPPWLPSPIGEEEENLA